MPVQLQAIIWTNDDLLSIGPLEQTSEIFEVKYSNFHSNRWSSKMPHILSQHTCVPEWSPEVNPINPFAWSDYSSHYINLHIFKFTFANHIFFGILFCMKELYCNNTCYRSLLKSTVNNLISERNVYDKSKCLEKCCILTAVFFSRRAAQFTDPCILRHVGFDWGAYPSIISFLSSYFISLFFINSFFIVKYHE